MYWLAKEVGLHGSNVYTRRRRNMESHNKNRNTRNFDLSDSFEGIEEEGVYQCRTIRITFITSSSIEHASCSIAE